MILSRKTSAPGTLAIVAIVWLFVSTSSIQSMKAQQPDAPLSSSDATAVHSETWHADQVTHLIGLPDIKERVKGSLSISPAALSFTTPDGHGSIDTAEILSVTIGDVRVETGGTAGKITRAMIPFGGGAAVATVTHKQVDLLTVEFRDNRNALHGAVFLLPKDEALQAQQQLAVPDGSTPVEQPHVPCQTGGGIRSNTLKLAPITTQSDPVPAEYRVLLYEQLVLRLRAEGSFAGIYRDGDDAPAAACTQYNLTLAFSAFKKGNAAVRASTGPVGYFVGTTSLAFHVQVRDLNGTILLEKDIKASQRGDSDSLNVADKIAKSLTKDLKKASAQAVRS